METYQGICREGGLWRLGGVNQGKNPKVPPEEPPGKSQGAFLKGFINHWVSRKATFINVANG